MVDFASIGEDKFPSILLGSVTGSKNEMVIRQLSRRRVYKFYFLVSLSLFYFPVLIQFRHCDTHTKEVTKE